jgi:hypothetical protein
LHYKQLAEKFPEEKDYILTNLNQRLADYGLSNKTILDRKVVGAGNGKTTLEKKKWFRLW